MSTYIEKLLFDISALTAVGKARAASSGISKRFISNNYLFIDLN